MTSDLRRVTIVPLQVGDPAAVEAAYQIECAVMAHDVPDLPLPCRYAFDNSLREPPPDTEVSRWLAFDGVEYVGSLAVHFGLTDNLDNAYVQLQVPPARRRHGIGRALFAQAAAHTRAAGRRWLIAESVATLEGGEPRDGSGSAFAVALGAKLALTDVRRRLTVAEIDRAHHDELLADAYRHAAGYSTVLWGDHVPDEYVDDAARLIGRLNDDAPIGDLMVEAEQYDANRVRRSEAKRLRAGETSYGAGIRHDATGALVAITDLLSERSTPEHAWQMITLVDPEHRGHRLGLIVKIENLRQATPLAVVDTWNAAQNPHMIGINELLGFRPVDAWSNWQVDLDPAGGPGRVSSG